MARLLEFKGYYGLALFDTPIGLVLLVACGVAAFITFNGVRALWMAPDPSSRKG